MEETKRRSHESESRFLQHKNNEKDCRHFNHLPPPKHPVRRTRPPNCKFFLRGTCKNGSACRFHHPVDIFDERRHETGSSSRPVKRAPDSRDLDPSQTCDETVAGSKRARLEHGQENVEEQRQEREIIERQIREADESFEERRWRERHAQDRQDIEEQRLRDIDTQRSEARLKIKQMKPTVEFNELIYGVLMHGLQYQDDMEEQRLREMKEKRARDLQIREEERLRDIERQRTEARMRLDQMQPTVKFDDPLEWEESLRELGFERREGDGF